MLFRSESTWESWGRGVLPLHSSWVCSVGSNRGTLHKRYPGICAHIPPINCPSPLLPKPPRSSRVLHPVSSMLEHLASNRCPLLILCLIPLPFLLGLCSPAGAGAPERRGRGQEADDTGWPLQTSHWPDAQRQLWNGEGSPWGADPSLQGGWGGDQDGSMDGQSQGCRRLGSDKYLMNYRWESWWCIEGLHWWWCHLEWTHKDHLMGDVPLLTTQPTWFYVSVSVWQITCGERLQWAREADQNGKIAPLELFPEKTGVRLLWIGEGGLCKGQCGLQHSPAEKLRWS